MWTRLSFRLPAAAAAVTLLVLLNACGGGGGNNVTAPPPPPPTPPPPQVVSQGAGLLLDSGFVGRLPFTTDRAGSLEATVDWTFATSDVDIAMVRGDCSFDQFFTGQCPILALSVSLTAKPEVIRADGAAAGAYTLFIENTGSDLEAISYQVILRPSATGVTASRVPEGRAALGMKKRPQGHVEW